MDPLLGASSRRASDFASIDSPPPCPDAYARPNERDEPPELFDDLTESSAREALRAFLQHHDARPRATSNGPSRRRSKIALRSQMDDGKASAKAD